MVNKDLFCIRLLGKDHPSNDSDYNYKSICIDTESGPHLEVGTF